MSWRERLAGWWRPWAHDVVLHEITPRCNARCEHCYNYWKDETRPDLSAPEELPPVEAAALVEKACRESRCTRYVFTGGEPCLRDDLEDLVRVARRYVSHITVITNGTLLPEARVRSLVDAGVGLFELPLHSADRDRHDARLGLAEAFERTTRAAADIRLAGAELAFVFVGTRHNIADWPEALGLGVALGARSFLFNRYNAGGYARARPEDLLPSVEQVKEALRIADDGAKRYGVGIGASIAIPPCLIDPSAYPNVGFGFCAAGTKRAYYTLGPDGHVRPCNHTPTTLGNLRERPFKRIVRRNPTLAAFMAARPAFCGGCRLERDCQGGCKAAAEVCAGDLAACEPFLSLNRDLARPLTSGVE